jgi:hypothetical protein
MYQASTAGQIEAARFDELCCKPKQRDKQQTLTKLRGVLLDVDIEPVGVAHNECGVGQLRLQLLGQVVGLVGQHVAVSRDTRTAQSCKRRSN